MVRGDWVTYVHDIDPKFKEGDLSMTNIKSQETITLTHTHRFEYPLLMHGLGNHLVAWYNVTHETPPSIRSL